MEKSLSFFRVFDIAFFAPGTVVFVAFWHAGLFSGIVPVQSGSIHEALTAVLVIIFIYMLGLICHMAQRFLLNVEYVKQILLPTAQEFQQQGYLTPWYSNLSSNNPRNDLALYFWYMRATCWNLAVAVIPAGLVYCGDIGWCMVKAFLISLSIISGLLILGREFDRSMRTAAK